LHHVDEVATAVDNKEGRGAGRRSRQEEQAGGTGRRNRRGRGGVE
jgi:hypothetical protein